MIFGKLHISRAFVVVLLTAAANVLSDPRSITKWYESASLVIAGALPGVKSAGDATAKDAPTNEH